MRRYFIKIMTKFELDLDQKRLHGGLGIKGTASLMLDGLGRLYKRSGMWEHWEEWHVRKLDKLCELTDPTLKHEARKMLISINKYKLERLADKAGPKSSGTSKPAK